MQEENHFLVPKTKVRNPSWGKGIEEQIDPEDSNLLDGARLGHFDRLSPYCGRVGRFSWQGYMVYNSATCERKVAKDVMNGISTDWGERASRSPTNLM